MLIDYWSFFAPANQPAPSPTVQAGGYQDVPRRRHVPTGIPIALVLADELDDDELAAILLVR